MKQIIKDLRGAFASSGIIVVLFAIMMMTKAVGFLPYIPETVGYGMMLLMAGYAAFKMKKVDMLMVVTICYLFINILICHPDSVFNSKMRLAFLVLLLIGAGPLLQSNKLRRYRGRLLNVTLWTASIFSVISFFFYFAGINFMFAGTIQDYNTAGHFGGAFNHSMILGPVAGVSSLFWGYNATMADKNTRKWYILLSLLCLGSVMLSASRSAFVCTLAGFAMMMMKATGGKRRFARLLTLIVLIGAITFPLWSSLTDGLMEKQEANIEMGSMTASREDKWDARITEFESSPVWGIGYASVDPHLDDVGIGGVIEPGTSWLAILSMTGIIGGLLFFYIFWRAYRACNKMRNKKDALLLGLLVLFAVHMMAEGYIFSAGSYLCFLVWMVIACCYDRQFENE